jgi:gliding motility-associated-like protein
MPIRLKSSIFSFGLFCILGIANTAYTQSFSNQHWYFGNNNIAVEFERPNNVPALITDYKTPPFNINGKGNATANSPETGNLLFYTDGFDIFDASFAQMVGATTTNLQADINKNQSVAISSVPGNNNRYFIFTNTAASGVQISEIDMTSNGNAVLLQPPLGSALSMNQPIANSTANPSDAMLILANAANDGYWLITLDQGTNNYKVLGIDSATPGSWLETIYTEGASMDAAHFTFNADSSKIAVAPKSANVNIQLLDFDLATGAITFDKDIPNSGNADFATEAIFDVEFSNDGSKLYYSRYGDQTAGNIGNLMQFDLIDTTIVLSPQSVLPNTVFGSYGLQLGPDGNLYHLYQETSSGPFLIGSLTDVDSVANLTSYISAIENGQNFNSFQFPAFLPSRSPQLTVDFTFAGECMNAPTAFFPQISPAPTNVQWDFGDGNGSNDLAPFNIYTASGPMTVTLTALLNEQPVQAQKTVTITDFQLQLTLPQDTVACQCELPKYGPTCTPFSITVQAQGGSGSETFLWSNGDVGATMMPDSAGYYYVVATDGTCSTYAGVQVQEYDVTIPGIAPDTRANIWYFGQNAGIDFNPPATNALTDGAMDAMEGCTAVSDRNGQIIFYTDGDILFDQTHTQIDVGLGGTPNATGSAAQSVISISVPGDETLFYIFTTQNTDPTSPDYNFSYSLFDLKQNNGLGGVIEKNIVLFEKSTERIAATSNWVIMHEYGNNNFRAYPISANGVGNAVVSSTGEDYSIISAENGKGYMKLGGTNLGLAVVEDNGSGSTNFLDVYDFDGGTGEVSNLRRADLSAAGAGSAYGIEFGGSKIFVSINNGSGSQIVEYWLDSNDSLNRLSIMPAGLEVGAIQLGPDGQIYVAQNGTASLGTISVGADSATASSYTASAFPLAGRNSQLGLPNFIQQTGTAGAPIGITVSSPVCLGQQIFIAANVSSSIDSLEWQISDPLGAIVFTSQNLVDTLTLTTAGVHTVALLIKNRCINPIGTFSDIITVSDPPQASDLPVSTFLCGPDVTLPVYTVAPPNIADLDFAWSTGETTSSIIVTQQGNYDVIITDRTSGCTATAATFVGPPLPIDAGPDQTICESDPLNLDSQVNADTYIWSINGVPQPGTRFFDFGALGLGGGTYTVQVDATLDLGGSIGPCTVTDQVIITVNPSPVFTAIEGLPATCGATDGTVDITLTSLGSFTYDIAGVTGTITDLDPMPVNVAGVGGGSNALILTNDVTGCSQLMNVVVTNPALFNIDAATANDESCALGDGSIDYTVAGTVAAFTTTVRDLNNATLTYAGAGNGAGNYSVTNIPAGDYSLEIMEDVGLNCIEIWIGNPPSVPPVAFTLTIGTPASSDLTVSANPILTCGTSTDLSTSVASITPGVTLEWSEDGFATAGNPIATAFTTFGSTNVSFRASATTGPPVTCQIIQTADVVLTPTPTVVINRDDSDICNGFVTLAANGDGGYPSADLGYRWNTGETTQSITVSQTGTNSFTVTTFHTINQSCLASVAESVTIDPPFTVALSSSLACDDGQPFTLATTVSGGLGSTPLLNYTWFLNNVEQGNIGSTIVALDAGNWKVVAEDTGSGCTSSDSLTVTRIPLTPTNLSSAPVFCPADSTLTLDAGSGFVSYFWNTGSTDQSISVSTGGLYEVAATNNFGCVTNDQSEAIEDCIPKVSGPNAFRPGGVNSTYSLFTEYIDTFEIFIYDRWGELVYNSSDAAFAWDGVYNGALLPAGQYSWVVRYTSSFRDRGTIEKYGGVVLLR